MSALGAQIRVGRAFQERSSIGALAVQNGLRTIGDNPLQAASVGVWNSSRNYFSSYLEYMGLGTEGSLNKEDLEDPELYKNYAGYLLDIATQRNGDYLSNKSVETYFSGSVA